MPHLVRAVRSLSRAPLGAMASVLTLALAIGVNTAIFSVVYGVLLRPLPFGEPSTLVQFTSVVQPDGRRTGVAAPEIADWVEHLERTASIAAYGVSPFTISGDGDAEALRGAVVSAGLFQLLGVNLTVGRALAAADNDAALVVLSDGLWRRRFGARIDIVGRRVILNAQPYTVVGIAPPRFRFPADDVDLWTPLGFAVSVAPPQWQMRGYRAFSLIGRLTSGATLAQAKEDARQTSRWLAQTYPRFNNDVAVDVEPLRDAISAPARPALLMLLAAAGAVLLIACANLASLALVRSAGRTREVAIRTALGATRRQLLAPFFAESAVVSACGAAAGLLLAGWTITGIVRLAPAATPRLDDVRLDVPVIVFTLAVAVLVALVCGGVSGVLSSHAPSGALRESRPIADRRTRRAHRVLVVAEISLSLVLLVGAILLARSLAALTHADIGVHADRVLTMKLNVAIPPGANPALQTASAAAVLEGVGRVAGVRSAAVTSSLPPHVSQMHTTLTTPALQIAGQPEVAIEMVAASADLFATLGIPLLRGRAIAASDTATSPRVLVLSATAARRLFPGRDPVGQRLAAGARDRNGVDPEVVGVVGDVKYAGLGAPAGGAVYLPYAQRAFQVMYLAVRTAADPVAMAAPLRRAIADADPLVAAGDARTLDDLSTEASAQPRFRTLLFVALAGLALVMAAVGLYGVIAHAVAHRAAEFGIRMALGAGRAHIVQLVMSEGVALTAMGLALGVGAALVVNRSLSAFLFGVGPGDPTSLLAAAAFVGVFGLLAALVPALAATRVDPLSALTEGG
jgi:putative ABC transport system permease protein